MSGPSKHSVLRTILRIAEAGYFADFEVVDEARSAGVTKTDAEELLATAADLGLLIARGPVRLTRYGAEVLESPAKFDDVVMRLEGRAVEKPAADEDAIDLPQTLNEWRAFQRHSSAAAAAVARGLMVSTAEVFFIVRSGSEDLFRTRFMRRMGRTPDDAYVRVAETPRARVSEGYVRWQGAPDLVSILLDVQAEAASDWSFISGEIAWQLVEEGWRPNPPQPVEVITEQMGRLAKWFIAGKDLSERAGTPFATPDAVDDQGVSSGLP